MRSCVSMSEMNSNFGKNSFETENQQNRGQNALQRRALQLKRWNELVDSEATPPKTSDPKVQFSAATLFLSAVAQNDVDECERLLRTTPDVNATTGDGLTALHQMAIDDNLDMCSWLLKNGADCNCKDNEGWTPLHASASCGHLEVVRLLLSRSECDVFAINCDGELARDVCDGQQCLEIIEKRMKLDLKTTMEVLDTEDSEDIIPESLLQQLRKKELLTIEEDLDLFVRRHPNPTPELFADWIERTRDPVSRATVLHVCAAKGYNECLKRILEVSHVEVDNWLDMDGFTALHATAFWQQLTSFETLLIFGANFELKTRDSRDVRDLCHENPKILELMSEKARELREKHEKSISSETQRKLNAKKQRESRRPTQGVSKEDIELALKTNVMTTDTTNNDKTDDSLNPPPMPSSSPPTTQLTTQLTTVLTTSEPNSPEQNGISVPVYPMRRRPKRRSTGIEEPVVTSDDKDFVDSQQKPIFSTTQQTTPETTTRSRSSSRSSVDDRVDDSLDDRSDDRDYKKLYKELLKEKEFLLKKIKDFENRVKSEKDIQEFGREKRQLLRRIGELEEELKTKEELVKENIRLKDENSALIRVISKLSK